ncbi:MAG: hypothetical protein HFH14_01020 [Lachnospiraceae bacterium]|nr:hypothetical protein [Lachnospiraceae bacterium]
MIEITGLTAVSDEKCILDNIDIHIKKGDFAVIFSPETETGHTLIHCIMGYNRDYKGSVKVNCDMRDVRYIPDDILWDEYSTAGEYMLMVAGASGNYDIKMQEMLCGKFNVHMDEKLLEMTFEDNKLVQIIAALCSKPELLILNMPQNFLGGAVKADIYGLLKDFHGMDSAIVVVCDSYEELKTYCGRYIYIKDGGVKADGYVADGDMRKRVITVGGNKSEAFMNALGPFLGAKNGRSSYLYDYEIRRIPHILGRLECDDYLIEEMTLEEEINSDFSRWE